MLSVKPWIWTSVTSVLVLSRGVEKLGGEAQHVCGSWEMVWHENHTVSSLRYFRFFGGLAFYFIMGEIQEASHAVP